MKKILIALFLLLAVWNATESAWKISQQTIVWCKPDSSSITQYGFKPGPIDITKFYIRDDSVGFNSNVALDTFYLRYDIDLWARTRPRIGSDWSGTAPVCTVEAFWSTSAISPWIESGNDTMPYHVSGMQFVTDSTSLGETVVTASNTITPTITNISGILEIQGKPYNVPSFLHLTAEQGGASFDSVGLDVYAQVRFFYLED